MQIEIKLPVNDTRIKKKLTAGVALYIKKVYSSADQITPKFKKKNKKKLFMNGLLNYI